MNWKMMAILLLISSPCMAQKITIRGKGLSLIEVLRQIRRETNYQLLYSPNELEGAPLMDVTYRDADVREVLRGCFAGLQLGYIMVDSGKISIFRKVAPNVSLYIPLEGRVLSTDGEPLEGASVSVDGIPQQVTCSGGSFRLPVKAITTVVTISFEGYSTQTLLLHNTEFHMIGLQPSASLLDRALVQAYGRTTARLAPGSIDEIDEHLIRDRSSGNVLDALQGQVPGMTVRQYNGVPGSAYGVVIRGRQSISQGTDPLVVVDGIPIAFNDGYLGTIGSGSAQGVMGASNLNGIPASAISSIEVLKGAAATAIYGSRGSNGVLLLTLKTGAAGRLKWDVDVDTRADEAVKTSPLLNTRQYLDLRKEAVENDGLAVNATTVPEAYLWDSTRYTNFKPVVMGHPGLRESVRIGVSGGDSNTVFLASANYHSEAAVFPGANKDERMSVYGHLHHQSINRRLRADLSALYSWEDNRLPMQDYTYYQMLAPNAPAFRDSTGQPSWSYQGIPYLNIVALENNDYRASVSSMFSRLQVSYDLWSGLVLKSNIGYYRIGSVERSHLSVAGQDPAIDPSDQTYYTGNASHSVLTEGLAEYTHKGRRSRLEGLAGVNWQGQWTNYSALDATDLLLSGGGGNTTVSTDQNSLVYKYEAIFGRINYIRDNRYIIDLSGRRDGSSRFGPGNQFGNFWAVGGAWIFSEEPFMGKYPWLSFGKLRGSLGTTGNDQIGTNGYEQIYAAQNTTRGYQGEQGVLPATFSNANLRWEVNYSSELSLDLGFLQNKIFLSATAYRDWTANQLIYISLPSQSGLPGVSTNVPANVVNEGLEFSLQTFNWTSGPFRWVSTFSLTAPVNRLAQFRGLSNSYYASSLVVGKSLSIVKGYQYEGVNPTTGLFQFRDVNHDGLLNGRDLVPGGNLDVHFFGGCDQSFRYKNWRLDLFFEFRRQNGVNPFVTLYQYNPPGFPGPSALSNGPVEWLHRWRQPGDHAMLQRATENSGTAAYSAAMDYVSSNAKVMDASFVRWKSLSLSYRLPDKLLRGWGLEEGQCYVRGQNLLTYTRFPVTDAETQDPTVLPPVRTVVMGVRVGF